MKSAFWSVNNRLAVFQSCFSLVSVSFFVLFSLNSANYDLRQPWGQNARKQDHVISQLLKQMNSALLNHFFAKKLEKNADFRPRVRTQIHPTHLTCFWLFPVTNWACSAFPRHLTLKTQCIALSIRRGLTFSATHRPRWRRENECVDKLPIITPSFSAKIPWVCGSQNTSSNFNI